MGIGRMMGPQFRSEEANQNNKIKMVQACLLSPELYVNKDLSIDMQTLAHDLKWTLEKCWAIYEELIRDIYERSIAYEKSLKFRLFRKSCERKEEKLFEKIDEQRKDWKFKDDLD